jgi:hypothetical protein
LVTWNATPRSHGSGTLAPMSKPMNEERRRDQEGTLFETYSHCLYRAKWEMNVSRRVRGIHIFFSSCPHPLQRVSASNRFHHEIHIAHENPSRILPIYIAVVVLARYQVEPDRSHEDDEEERLGGACWRIRKKWVRVRSL